ncbi:MucR family transcriptional regulator [Sphingobium sp. DEHP117]|uniref:MucR family transcriptional regulator n=1 Tax=Sphingobium sp. DEHP117 TaxID=2993436 RepID=UPI0027D4AE07|nr:MucR family transcriptional regulator [Sphingobium sp. DEHP117]MDQ4422167.1 MucR family transcriptional regulator [Sphingobium sp. DEHP117]
MDKFDARQATLDLVTAFVNNNSLKAQELPSLLSDVYGAIAGFGEVKVDSIASQDAAPVEAPPQLEAVPAAAPAPGAEKSKDEPQAAVSVEASLADPNYIVSMITGERLKTLARHLKRHGLDAEQYRARYNLPNDYPMVAPAYSEVRRAVAKKMALGSVGRAKPASTASAPLVVVPAAPIEQASVDATTKARKAPVQKAAGAKKLASDGKVASRKQVAKAAKPDQVDVVPSVLKKARTSVRQAASAVLQKDEDAVVSPPRARRSKLTPVFNG